MPQKNKKHTLNLVSKAFLMISVLIIAQISFSVMLAPEARAESPGCCEKTKAGPICQYVNDIPTECDRTKSYSEGVSCENTDYCQPGCCFSSTDGKCDEMVPQEECYNEGRSWEDAPNCQIAQCSEGCCMIGINGFIVNAITCKALSRNNGILDMIFKEEITDPTVCADEALAMDKGCCKLSNACSFGTRDQCSGLGGEFHLNVLCAADRLNCPCTAHATKKCVENSDKVYWFDSCGNRENVWIENEPLGYKSNVYSENESCGSAVTESNLNSSGCCDQASNTVCGKKPSGTGCISINCPSTYISPNQGGGGGNKAHLNSWCIYDSNVTKEDVNKDRVDPVGSQHWRHKCLYGEEIFEPCDDYRATVCMEAKSESITFAKCVPNMYGLCLNATSKTDCGATTAEDINLSDFCRWDEFSWNGGRLGYCNPKYPIGMTEDSKGNCSIGTRTCTQKWISELTTNWGEWKIDTNTQECFGGNLAFRQDWVEFMNKRCYSVGDCGAYVNIIGEGNLSYKINTAAPTGAQTFAGQSPITLFYRETDKMKLPDNYTLNISKKLSLSANLTPSSVPYLYQVKEKSMTGDIIKTITGKTVQGAAVATAMAWVAASLCGTGIGCVIGILVLAAAALVLVIDVIVDMIHSERTSSIQFQCMGWEPPAGGKNCEECNKDPMKPCSKYRCSSLGAACALKGEAGNYKCYWNNSNDRLAPVIKNIAVTPGYSATNTSDTLWQIKNNSQGLELGPYTNFAITIETNELARCRIETNLSVSLKGFNSMRNDIESNSYKYKHTQNFVRAVAGYAYANDFSFYPGSDNYYYVNCIDANGNKKDAPVNIRFKVGTGPDLTPPRYVDTTIKNGKPVAYGTSNLSVGFYIDEIAKCRWDTQDIRYSEMNHTFDDCVPSPHGADKAFLCNALLKIGTGTNKYYFGCNDTSGNINPKNYPFEVTKSSSMLGIRSARPSGNIYGNFDLVPVDLAVETENGAEGGTSVCKYSIPGYSPTSTKFLDTNSVSHSSKVFLPSGSWKINIRCDDDGGNIANTTVEVKVSADRMAPKLTRVYNDGWLLKVITDEASTCAYSTKSCSFKFEDGTEMAGTDKEHVTDWVADSTYYMQCKDSFGNSKCTATVKTYEK